MSPAKVLRPGSEPFFLDEDDLLNVFTIDKDQCDNPIFRQIEVVSGTTHGFGLLHTTDGAKTFAANEGCGIKRRSAMLPDGTIIAALSQKEYQEEVSRGKERE